MSRKDIFDGESYQTLFADKVYSRLRSREWFSSSDVMADVLGEKHLSVSVSKCKYYSELKKVLPKVIQAIREKNLVVEERGNNRTREYRYTGEDDDPLRELQQAKAIRSIEKYWRFCQDSSGFFPMSWLEYFFKDSTDLIDIRHKKKKGEQIVGVSNDRILKNIDMLPSLYEAIKERKVLAIDYASHYNSSNVRTLTFHPHYLNEFNGRWYLLGHAEGEIPDEGYHLALDRIVGSPRTVADKEFVPAPPGFYDKMFQGLVGVTFDKEEGIHPVPVLIRAHSQYMFYLTATKPLHSTQRIAAPYDEEKGYGDFEVTVCPNKEFFGRVMQMGSELEIISPENVREEMAERVLRLVGRYRPNT